MNTIEANAAGKFYTSDPTELRNEVERFTRIGEGAGTDVPIGLIVPHAGYMFSGSTAGKGYSALRHRQTPELCFVFAPSHRHFLRKPTICTASGLASPLGIVETSKNVIQELLKHSEVFQGSEDAFVFEHAIEVQLPFLQFLYDKSLKIIPILFSIADLNTLRQAAEILAGWMKSSNLFIISSDFSHYTDYDFATKLDAELKDAIVRLDTNQFINLLNAPTPAPNLKTRACGSAAILTWMHMCNMHRNISAKSIDYTNSGDSVYSHNKDSVVGYYSILFQLQTAMHA